MVNGCWLPVGAPILPGRDARAAPQTLTSGESLKVSVCGVAVATRRFAVSPANDYLHGQNLSGDWRLCL
jgi:hypothetical protein